MSKGTKVYAVRLDDDLTARIWNELARSNRHYASVGTNMSDFIRSACEEKLRHAARGRAKRGGAGRGRKGTTGGAGKAVAE